MAWNDEHNYVEREWVDGEWTKRAIHGDFQVLWNFFNYQKDPKIWQMLFNSSCWVRGFLLRALKFLYLEIFKLV